MKWLKINESKKDYAIHINNNGHSKDMRDLMNHAMTAEDELFTIINTANRILRYKDSEELKMVRDFAKNAMDSVSEAKIMLRDVVIDKNET